MSQSTPSYLQKRRRRWYAVMEIPRAARATFGGKRRFVQSLETDSFAIARQRVGPVLAAWRSQKPMDDAGFYRRALRKAKTPEARATVLEHISDKADALAAETIEPGQPYSSSPEAQAFFAKATAVEFSQHLDEWLDTSRATPKTKDMQRADVMRFAAKFATVQEIARPEVRRWTTELMNGANGLKPKTVQRILSALRGYWRFLQTVGVAGEDAEPFAKLDVARQATREAPRAARQPFEPGDVLKLYRAAIERDDEELANLIRLGMWTGCRIEELCALKVGKVKKNHFAVDDAKTAAGWREVPIHSKLAPTLARLTKGKLADSYVLVGLAANKYGDRSNAIGKRFGHLKSELGFDDRFVFHSIRKTVVTLFENAGVSENVVADIVGHEKPRITYGLYSGGTSLAVKAAAMAKLAY